MSKKSRRTVKSVPRQVRAAPTRKPGILTVLVPLILLLIVGLIWTSALLISRDSANEAKSSDTPTAEPSSSVYPTDTSRPGGSVDKQRQVLANQALELLKQAKLIAAQPNVNKILTAVAQGDDGLLPRAFVANFRFVDKVQDEKEIRAAGLISIIQLGQVLNKSIPGNIELKLLTDTAYKFVYVDMAAGNAYVPLTLYLGKDAAFSFEYVWVDKQWAFSPYSLIDAISAADTATKGANLPSTTE